MKAIAFDTLEFVKRLRAANFSEAQAEAMVEAIAAVVTEQLATKADLQDLRRDLMAEMNDLRRHIDAGLEAARQEARSQQENLRRDLEGQIEALRRDLEGQIEALRRDLEGQIEALRRDVAELRRELKESEYRLTIRLGGMLAAAVAVVAALVKLL